METLIFKVLFTKISSLYYRDMRLNSLSGSVAAAVRCCVCTCAGMHVYIVSYFCRVCALKLGVIELLWSIPLVFPLNTGDQTVHHRPTQMHTQIPVVIIRSPQILSKPLTEVEVTLLVIYLLWKA